MTSNAKVSDSEKSGEVNAPGEENIETTAEDTMNTLSGQTCNTQTKHVNKQKKRDSNGHGDSPNISADILAAIQELSSKRDETFCKISVIELTTEAMSQRIKKLSSTVEQLVVDINHHKDILKKTELEIEQLKKENWILRAGVAENKRYSYRWTLVLNHPLRAAMYL